MERLEHPNIRGGEAESSEITDALMRNVGKPIVAIRHDSGQIVLGLNHGVRDQEVFIRDSTDQVESYSIDNWLFYVDDQAALELFAALQETDAPLENGYRST